MAPRQSDHLPATAESRFRDAFHRLRDGCPRVLELGCKVTQNNVAREAGCDPSALKKTRFPTLVSEIQAFTTKPQYVAGDAPLPRTPHNAEACLKCAGLREQLLQLTLQRDASMSALVLADSHILELTQRVIQLEGAATKDANKRLLR